MNSSPSSPSSPATPAIFENSIVGSLFARSTISRGIAHLQETVHFFSLSEKTVRQRRRMGGTAELATDSSSG